MSVIRAACVQLRTGVDRAANLEAAEALIREAAADGATLILTPEMTTLLDRERPRLRASLEQTDVDEVAVFSALSEELGATIIIGSMPVPVDGEDKVANTQFAFSGGQLLATYDKIHLFDVDLPTGESWRESSLYRGGDEAVLIEAEGSHVGLSICYDLRFPHLYRGLAKEGAEILTIPAAFTVPTGKAHWEVLLRARAIETGSFVLAAAQGGTHEDGRVTYGHSLIISPWGEVLAEKPDDEPGVIAADLDLERCRDMRTRIPSLGLDRPVAVRTFTP
ncbi:MAG: carbon-nitrogen hydrolase family protein [Pseudomonadota bacterium]